MLDRLVAHEGDTASFETGFADKAYVIEDGRATEAAVLECIAQAMAALRGILLRERGEAVTPGLLVGVDGFRMHGPVDAGATVRIDAAITRRMGRFNVAKAELWADGTLTAEATLTFYMEEESLPSAGR